MIKGLLYIAILTTAVVASWIGFSAYHNYTTSTISSDAQIRITPISPDFDMEIINSLKSRTILNPDLKKEKQILSDKSSNPLINENEISATASGETTQAISTESGTINL